MAKWTWLNDLPQCACRVYKAAHLSRCRSRILSVCSLSLWEIRVLSPSTVSPRGTVSSTGLPVVEVMDKLMEDWAADRAGAKLRRFRCCCCCCSIQPPLKCPSLKTQSGSGARSQLWRDVWRCFPSVVPHSSGESVQPEDNGTAATGYSSSFWPWRT